jgi:hypothetical protein
MSEVELPKENCSLLLDADDCAVILKNIFHNKDLWESRRDRSVSYRNGEWFTIGTPIYLDLLSPSAYPTYLKKVMYFNKVLENTCFSLLCRIEDAFGAKHLRSVYPKISLPGFHIFPGFETFNYEFGKPHKDLQWTVLHSLPDFPFSEGMMRDHFSFTLVLKAPYLGARLNLHNEEGLIFETFHYTERMLYTHSGKQTHSIAPFKHPVLPGDFRITFQGHGFTVGKDKYLYW